MSTDMNTVGRAQHSEPTFTLYGRIAATYAGYIGRPYADLHLSLIIDDAYNGITVIDGQPTFGEAGLHNLLRIRTNIYTNELPGGVIVKIPLDPPAGMSRETFARELVIRATNFASYVSPYRPPAKLRGDKMNPGEYNSSSYLAALLKSVMGYVPAVHVVGYQTPGWEQPMPLHFFKGEALR
ncbi:hypothetical protein EJP67_11825 [Variovorax guangxiensis]|uniref:Uncharacterized protein n=1 Tax=Variovorax guangxiensis TaxID=1775474 RepID=A0A3S0Z994_9BURK|nr:hypothetical protein [Variovorax guangxiensis]RUR67743.1 hypothetical protein EJP67_11825 [Variovorax guangxiensis]